MADSTPYLTERLRNIRERPLPWEGYQRSGLITETELQKIKSVDKTSKDKRVQTVAGDARGYAVLILGDGGEGGILERAVKRNDVLQYTLVLMNDLLDIPEFLSAALQLPSPFDHLITLLQTQDDTVPLLASRILTVLFAAALAGGSSNIPTPPAKTTAQAREALPLIFKYFADFSKNADASLQDLAIQSYVALLRNPYARVTFWQLADETVKPLVDILQAASAGTGRSSAGATGGTGIAQGGVGLQLLYHVLLVIWELSFEEVVTEEIQSKFKLIPTVLSILRSAIKEKIARLSLSILSNLIQKSPQFNLPSLSLLHPLSLLASLQQKYTSDPDLTADLNTLVLALENFLQSQTTFDEYATEIRTGDLTWSPPHRSTDFWKKNARRIVEENNGDLVKELAKVFENPTPDPSDKVGCTIMAVAAHDVAMLVREIPEKRRVWEALGVKGKCLQLMQAGDPEVRYEALGAVQAFMEHALSL